MATMQDRYQEIDEHTPITEDHRIDYQHLNGLWERDSDTMSVWQMRYLHLLEHFGAGPNSPIVQQPNLVPGRRYVITSGHNVGLTVTFVGHHGNGDMIIRLPLGTQVTGQWVFAREGHKFDLWVYKDGLVHQTRGAISLNPSLQDIWETEDGDKFRDDSPGGGPDREKVYSWAIDSTRRDIRVRRGALEDLDVKLAQLEREVGPAPLTEEHDLAMWEKHCRYEASRAAATGDGPVCPIEEHDPFPGE